MIKEEAKNLLEQTLAALKDFGPFLAEGLLKSEKYYQYKHALEDALKTSKEHLPELAQARIDKFVSPWQARPKSGTFVTQQQVLDEMSPLIEVAQKTLLEFGSNEKIANTDIVAVKAPEESEEYDVFISHASEDKEFVKKLVDAIHKEGIKVWYDTREIVWGDDLRSTIDRGLSKSKYGIVVFSKYFLGKKKWTQYELNALFAREDLGKKIVLPIWHNISRADLLEYGPAWADRVAKRSDKDSIEEIVSELKKLLES
jgi:hypothetical protein